MTHQPNHHMPPCGCPPMQPVAVGEINYSAEQINQLLALIPLKMDRKELHGLISYTSDNYIGHVPDTTSLKPQKAFAWAFVGELSGASPYFYYTPDFIPEGLEQGWNDMSSFFGKYNMTPSKKEDTISAEELFAGYFRLPTLTADKAIADEQGNRIIDTYVKREAVANHIKETYNKQFTENPPLITKGYITPEMLSEETRQMLEATGQDITNLPDGEDLQAVHGVLKFANKEYNPNSYDGLGRQYIRRNIVNGVNTLVQSMVQWSNTLYIIRYDHDLQGRTITIPEGCTLMFESGKFFNGKLVLNDTQVRPYGCLLKDYIDCQIEGTFRKGQVLYSEQYKQTEVWTGKKWKCSYSVLFRVNGNKLQQSLDDGDTWEDVSDYIASYFRFVPSSGQNSVGKIQISRDNKTWSDLSGEFTNYMRIADYVATTAELPQNAPQGIIYGVGPVDGSTYTLYVNTSKGWINNGSFTSFAAGIVQETGNNENVVMSQKAVTEKFNEQEEKLAELGSKLIELKGLSIPPSDDWGTIDSTSVYYNPEKKLLRYYNDGLWQTIPFVKGAIYTYESRLYVWNGEDLIESNKDLKDLLELYKDFDRIIFNSGYILKDNYRNNLLEDDIEDGVYLLKDGKVITSSQGRSIATMTSAKSSGGLIIEYRYPFTYNPVQANIAIYKNDIFLGSRNISGIGCILIPYGYTIKMSSTRIREVFRWYDSNAYNDGSIYMDVDFVNEMYFTSKLHGYTDLQLQHFWSLGSINIGDVVQSEYYDHPDYACLEEIVVTKGQSYIIKTIGGKNALAYGFADVNRVLYEKSPINADYSNGVVVTAKHDGVLFVNTRITNNTFSVEKESVLDSLQRIGNENQSRISEKRILWIGNSFTDDMTAYIKELAEASSINNVSMYICVISGGTLENWAESLNNDELVTLIWRCGQLDADYGYSNSNYTLSQILSKNWDIVGFNQASSKYIDYQSYHPYFGNLLAKVKEICPNANVKIGWQMAWSRWEGYGSEPMGESGWENIVDVTKILKSDFKIDYIIPTGTAIQLARNYLKDDIVHDLTRDGLHLSYGAARYIAACCLYNVVLSDLTGIKLYGNLAVHDLSESESASEHFDSIPVDDANRLELQRLAIKASESPFYL